MPLYKVTLNVPVVYEVTIDAPSQDDAIDQAFDEYPGLPADEGVNDEWSDEDGGDMSLAGVELVTEGA